MKAYFPIFYFLLLIPTPATCPFPFLFFSTSLPSLTQFVSLCPPHPLPHFFNRKIIIFSSLLSVPFFKMNIFEIYSFFRFCCRYTISFLLLPLFSSFSWRMKGRIKAVGQLERGFSPFFSFSEFFSFLPSLTSFSSWKHGKNFFLDFFYTQRKESCPKKGKKMLKNWPDFALIRGF